MIQLLILSFFTLVNFSVRSLSPQLKTIRIEDAPYMAAISSNEKYIASGAIISRYNIITVAQSFYYTQKENVTVIVGSSYYMWGGTKFPVSEFFFHPDYNPIAFDYNFLVLQLADPLLRFSEKIRPIPLPDYNGSISDKDMLFMSGWGKTANHAQSRVQLRAVRLPAINTRVCQEQIPWFRITPRMICLGGSTDQRGPCLGDNGAPAIFKNQLIGLASMGSDCRKPQGPPSIFTRVSSVRKWLERVIVN